MSDTEPFNYPKITRFKTLTDSEEINSHIDAGWIVVGIWTEFENICPGINDFRNYVRVAWKLDGLPVDP